MEADDGNLYRCHFYGPDSFDVDRLCAGDIVSLDLAESGSSWRVTNFTSERYGLSRKALIIKNYGSYQNYVNYKKGLIRKAMYGPGYLSRLDRAAKAETTIERGEEVVEEIRGGSEDSGRFGISQWPREKLIAAVKRLLEGWEKLKAEVEKWKALAGWYEHELDKLRDKTVEPEDEIKKTTRKILSDQSRQDYGERD